MKHMSSLKTELEVALDLAKIAGDILLKNRNNPLEIRTKKDNSIVCDADKESSNFLSEELSKRFPDYGILDEENIKNNTLTDGYCWIIDPLDGTIEYVNNGDNFGVLIGLMKNFIPILGVAYRPKMGEIIYGIINEGAYIINSEGKRKLNVSNSNSIDVLISSYRKCRELTDLLKLINPDSVRSMPSSFKTIDVAKGSATLFLCPASITMNLWDICAPDIILHEAGGKLSNLYGEPIDYSGNIVNLKGIVASNGVIHNEILRKISNYIMEM